MWTGQVGGEEQGLANLSRQVPILDLKGAAQRDPRRVPLPRWPSGLKGKRSRRIYFLFAPHHCPLPPQEV